VIDWVEVAGARWAAFMWPTLWHATLVALVALILLPAVRRVSPVLGLALLSSS
jgi:hypothetical protein